MCQMVASYQPDPGLELNNSTSTSNFYYSYRIHGSSLQNLVLTLSIFHRYFIFL